MNATANVSFTNVSLSWRGDLELILTETDTFLADPNVLAAVPEAMAELSGVPVGYVTSAMAKIEKVTRIQTDLTWELQGMQHLTRRSPVKLDYTILVPAGSAMPGTYNYAGMNKTISAVTIDRMQRSLRNV